MGCTSTGSCSSPRSSTSARSGCTRADDRACVAFLPTYAAVAHYHGLHPGRSLAEVLADAEEYAEREYPWVLARGMRLTEEEVGAAASRIAGLTGLSVDYVRRSNLRIEHLRFFTELLRLRACPWVGWTPGSPVRRGRERRRCMTPTRRTTRSPARMPPPSTTTSGPTSVRQRPPLRAGLRAGQPVVVQGVRGS